MDIVVREKDRMLLSLNKTISQLKRRIYKIKNIFKPAYESYFCVVYSLNDDADHIKGIEIL